MAATDSPSSYRSIASSTWAAEKALLWLGPVPPDDVHRSTPFDAVRLGPLTLERSG